MVGKSLLDRFGLRKYLTRLVQFFLGFDGLLHGLELFSAYQEEAWATFTITLFHTLIFVLAFYFVGHDHSHHSKQNNDD